MKVFIFAVAAAVFISGFWLIAIPEDFLGKQLERLFEGSNLSVEVTGFKKGMFYSFMAQNIKINKSGRELVSIDDLSVKANPVSLLLLKLPLTFEGHAGGGKIYGNADFLMGRKRIDIVLENASMERIPFFAFAGLNGRGIFSGELKAADHNGSVRFSIKDMKIGSGAFFNVSVPLDMFCSAKGAITINGDDLTIDAFSMEGRDIYARIKGNVRVNNLDLTLEIMPESSFIDTSNILPLIENFRRSPGYYVIPIKNAISL